MKSSSHRRIVKRLGLSAAALALTVPLAAAGETSETGPGDTPATVEPRPADERQAPSAGLRVFVDPVTGEITSSPSREQQEALSAALKSSFVRSAEGLETFELATGGHGVHLAGRFHTATVVRRQADGTLDLECGDHPAEADAGEPDAGEPDAGEPDAGERRWEEK